MRVSTVVAAIATFSLGLGVISQAAAAPDEPKQTASARLASKALADARAVTDDNPATGVADGRDATLVLRDLALNKNQLSGADRAAAARILARPTDPTDDDYLGTLDESTCGTNVCIHWTEEVGNEERINPTDTSPDNGFPDYVDQVMTAMDTVHTTYVAAGYRAPKSDGGIGGTNQPDIYLANIGDVGYYGYCTTDQPNIGPPWDVWAYCVLDNDFSSSEFPTNTPIENMQVTAAHEYFHAVQYAYDVGEDRWFMEATATWAEDEVYDAVNDNVNYLPSGQLGQPRLSLDQSANGSQYGNWIFFRYLTEKYGASQGGMPKLVRDMWRRADGAAGGQDQFALQAVVNTVQAAGGNFAKLYAGFADANRRPRKAYDEGASQRYPTAPLAFRAIALSPNRPGTTWGSLRLNHLTSATASFKPKRTTAKKWKLNVQVDMAPRARGSLAVVSVYYKNGKVRSSFISLNAKGKGAKNVPFSSKKVNHVETVLVNASTRGNKDNRLVQKLRATAHR